MTPAEPRVIRAALRLAQADAEYRYKVNDGIRKHAARVGIRYDAILAVIDAANALTARKKGRKG